MAGGGGGFLMTPLLISLGLTPAQAVATGKYGGLAVSIGTLVGFRGHHFEDKKILYTLIGMATVIGLVAPHLITSLDPNLYKKLIGLFLILLSIIILTKKLGRVHSEVSEKSKLAGLALVFCGFSLMAVFSSGLGVLVNVALMGLVGLTSIESAIIKRSAQLLLNSLLVIGVTVAGLIAWRIVAVGAVGNLGGAYIGSSYALKKGPEFVGKIMAALGFLSGAWLLLV